MRFKPGQKIVCTNKGIWWDPITRQVRYDPKFNEVVTVTAMSTKYPDFVILSEYPLPDPEDGFVSRCFEPIIEDSVLEAELQSIPEPCTTTN